MSPFLASFQWSTRNSKATGFFVTAAEHIGALDSIEAEHRTTRNGC
jgi:hypothetical protein